MKILAFDTTAGLSVALVCDGKILVENVIDEKGRQAEMLVPLIEKTLQQVGIPYQDLNAIAVTKGPGSFTSVRIGLVTAQTLQLALGIPLIALTTNEVAAFMRRDENGSNSQNSDEKISTAIDAGMGEFFCADFVFEKGLPEMVGEIELVKEENLLGVAGVSRSQEARELATLSPKISAKFVALLAHEKIQKSPTECLTNSQNHTALYLRAARVG